MTFCKEACCHYLIGVVVVVLNNTCCRDPRRWFLRCKVFGPIPWACHVEEFVSENENELEVEAKAIAPTVSPVKLPVKFWASEFVKSTA